jgi:two-component system, chemotaxis family, chemotaxis protein CheY
MKKVIIVDDSATARMFTRKCLEMAGLECDLLLELPSAIEAVPYLNDPDLDLMIIDLVMPKMSGRELLEKRRASGSKVSVIVVSSAVNRAEEDDLLKLGARVVMRKPFSPASALSALETVRG